MTGFFRLILSIILGILLSPSGVIAKTCTEAEMQAMMKAGLNLTRIMEICEGVSNYSGTKPTSPPEHADSMKKRSDSADGKNNKIVCQSLRSNRNYFQRTYEKCERDNESRRREDDTRRRQSGHVSDPGFNPPFQILCQGYAMNLNNLDLKIAANCD